MRPAAGRVHAPRAGVSLADRFVLLQAAACVVPAALALVLGDPTLAARWTFAVLTLGIVANVFFARPTTPLVLVVATLPMTLLLRNQLLYNGPPVILVATTAWLVVRSPSARTALLRPTFIVTALVATAYWLASWLITGHYDVNFRLIEMLGGAAAVAVLASRRGSLATSAFGMAGALAAIGLALLRYGERLGYADVAGVRLGNPISFGLPLALLLTLTIADRGRWFGLDRAPGTRVVVGALVGLLLVLSTSRGAWLVAVVCLAVAAVLERQARRIIVFVVATITVAVAGVAQTSRGVVLAEWADRTFSTERSMSNRTSGRSDQWMLLPAVLRDVPPWGFGPGSGGQIYARYSVRDPRVKLLPGAELQWHSLYQHLAVETGLIGIVAILTLLGVLARASFAAWRQRGLTMPLVGGLGFALVALTVSGMDAVSGLFLGFAFAACVPVRYRRAT